MILGVTLFLRVWWFVAIVLLLFVIYYERIILAEEKFLGEKFGERFWDWASKTPAVLPNFARWKPPAISFSLKSVIRREYHSFFGIIVLFTYLVILSDYYLNGEFIINPYWLTIFSIGLSVYLVTRLTIKCTSLLDVGDR